MPSAPPAAASHPSPVRRPSTVGSRATPDILPATPLGAVFKETPVMEPPALPLPTFLIIGAQKSATRWLRLNLGLHPDVFSASSELEFFNNAERVERGGDSYRAQFEGWSGESYVGEATPGYMFWHHGPRVIAGRIRQTVPDVRLIAILRNPVDRAQSAVVHHIKGGSLAPGSQVLDVVKRTPPERDPLGIVSGGWYA